MLSAFFSRQHCLIINCARFIFIFSFCQSMLDTSFEHFHYIPNTPQGEVILKLLTAPELMAKFNHLLLSDLHKRKADIPIEHDAIDENGTPTLLAYDFDMQRINLFNTGLNVYGSSGNLICFDFQIPVLKKSLTADIHISPVFLLMCFVGGLLVRLFVFAMFKYLRSGMSVIISCVFLLCYHWRLWLLG